MWRRMTLAGVAFLLFSFVVGCGIMRRGESSNSAPSLPSGSVTGGQQQPSSTGNQSPTSPPSPSAEESKKLDQGFALLKVGKADEAAPFFQSVLKKNPGNSYAHLGLGDVHLSKKEFNPAIDEFNAAIRTGSQDFGPYAGLGDAYFFKGDKVKAKEFYQKVLSMNPPIELKQRIEKNMEQL